MNPKKAIPAALSIVSTTGCSAREISATADHRVPSTPIRAIDSDGSPVFLHHLLSDIGLEDGVKNKCRFQYMTIIIQDGIRRTNTTSQVL